VHCDDGVSISTCVDEKDCKRAKRMVLYLTTCIQGVQKKENNGTGILYVTFTNSNISF